MAQLKDSPKLDMYRVQYQQLWDQLQNEDEDKVEELLYHINKRLLPAHRRFMAQLRPFKTHSLWIVPLSVLVTLSLLYVGFVWVALLVE